MYEIGAWLQTYPHGDTATFPTFFRRQTVWLSQVGSPISSPDGQHAEFGYDDGGADGSSDFFGGLDTKANVPF